MKYYDYTSIFEVNSDLIQKYIVKRDSNNEVFKLCFDESQSEEYLSVTNDDWCFDLGVSLYYIGEDGYIYEFKPDGAVLKGEKCPKNLNKRLWNYRLKMAEKTRKDKNSWKKYLDDSHLSQINFMSKSVLGFDKYIFKNADNDYVIPFRLKKAKSSNAPLLVYYHGAGSLGHDNYKQLFEFFNVNFGKKFPDCNILIPQSFNAANFLVENTEVYIKNCVELIGNILDICSFDPNRRYCFGTSFGGCCVWYSISMYPELFAAAMPVMGTILHVNKYLPFLKENNTLPIWMAHSSNDNNVSIIVDDYLYNELKDVNPNLKYTRWDKYGHRMAGHFYMKEPYIQWMFDQSLDKR